jgi:hypothetical protein
LLFSLCFYHFDCRLSTLLLTPVFLGPSKSFSTF